MQQKEREKKMKNQFIEMRFLKLPTKNIKRNSLFLYKFDLVYIARETLSAAGFDRCVT